MRAIVALCLVGLLSAGCGPPADVRAVQEKAQGLVTKRASLNEVAAVFARAPIHTYTRAEAFEQMLRIGPTDVAHKYWQKLSEHPKACSFPMPGGEVLVFFDDSGRATGFYSNIQL